jgi:hypothetical protein
MDRGRAYFNLLYQHLLVETGANKEKLPFIYEIFWYGEELHSGRSITGNVSQI